MREADEKQVGAVLPRFVEALNCWDIVKFKKALEKYLETNSESELCAVLTRRDYVKELSSDGLFCILKRK